jgi:hypothetical protein
MRLFLRGHPLKQIGPESSKFTSLFDTWGHENGGHLYTAVAESEFNSGDWLAKSRWSADKGVGGEWCYNYFK